MNNRKWMFPLLLLLVFLAAGGLGLFTQVTVNARAEPLDPALASYAISWQVFASGGSQTASSTSYIMQSTVGQPVTGSSQSASYQMCSGFWCGVKEWVWKVFLPIVLRTYP